MIVPESLRLAWRNLRVNTDPGSLVVILGLPAMYLIFMGTMYVSIIPSFLFGGYEFTYTSFLASGIIAFESLMAGTMGGSMLWADRRFGMFSQILSGPFTRTQYLSGVIIATVAASLAGSLVLIGLAIPLGAVLQVNLLGGVLVLFSLILGGIFFCSLMLFVAAKVDSNQAYNSIQILIIFVLSFISDAYYPINSQTPLVLQIISMINPMTYVADGVRAGLAPQNFLVGILNSHPIPGSALPWEPILLLVETVAMFFLAYKTYQNVKLNMS
ncbi:MAG: ABC transporter permease [Nitrososphaerales archaeon]